MSTVEKKIEKLGRIVLPIEFREKLGIKNNSIVSVSLQENQISIFVPEYVCALCKNRISFKNSIMLCQDCISKVKKLK